MNLDSATRASLPNTSAYSFGRNAKRALVGLLILESLALLVLGQRAMSYRYLPHIWVVTWAGGLAALVLLDNALGAPTARKARTFVLSEVLLGRRNWILLGATIPMGWYIWNVQHQPARASYWDIVALWCVMMATSLFAVAWPITLPNWTAWRARLRSHWQEILIVSGITAIAFGLRIYELSDYPEIFSGDEGLFARTAREVVMGKIRNPFDTTFDAQVSAWVFLQAGMMKIFGEGIVGARIFETFVGTATIPIFYLLIRRNFGKTAAIVGAALLATFHFHIYMSRDALNNVSATFFLALTLLLLDQLLETWSPTKAVQLGLVIGLAQYGYISNRLLVPIALAVFIVTLVLHHPRKREELLAAGQSLLLLGIGITVAFLPMAAYFSVYPGTFNARLNAVSVFGSGWLELEESLTGKGPIYILWHHFLDAALVPIRTSPSGYYQIEPPFIGWPLVIPAALGLAIVTVGFFRRRYLPIAISYWVVMVGLGMTVSGPETNRYAAGALLLPLVATVGVMSVARMCRSYLGFPRAFVLIGLAAFITLSGVWNVRVAFNKDLAVYRKPNLVTIAINDFAHDLRQRGPGYTVYFGAPPTMFYGGRPMLHYLAPGAVGIDVLEPWTSEDRAPVLTGPTLFFFLPERRDELDVVRAWFPGGQLNDYRDENGELLYTSYVIDAPAILPYLPQESGS